MKKNFYILRNGKLIRKGNTIYFIYEKSEEKVFSAEIDGEEMEVETEDISDKQEYEKRVLPIEQISSLFIYGRVSLTSGVISFLSKNNIPVHFFGYYGNYESTLMPKEMLLSGEMHIKQAMHYISQDKRVFIAKRFVEGSAQNILRNLEYYQREGKDLQEEISYITNASFSIENCKDVSQLLALEGAIRSKYYSSFNKILKSFEFDERTRQPPENPLNAMISFGNSLLYATVIKQIYHTQLDQTISFLHEPSERRFSLALDISEIFKPLLVDRIIFKLVNKDIIGEDHFVKELNSCLLNNKGKEIFLREYDEKLQTTIKHRDLGRNVSYERLIYLECLKLCKHFLGIKDYKPFVIWW
ncbi:MAG: type I-B CRISPR-associated endonuclease Cas1 [Thermoplasmatales archaeon]|nr:type I-B CRISPR-associated endonuclease Cas1 [Thermoplasmatales archaeon]